ncbi:helix-turn-helix transcriptional regulator, partial [Bacillus thuringiensis]|uniref:helix-turn-helix domain-containing protein n=1 Tax=Bacillus thuringiensis TaxID=1428 RepID=UPI002AB523A3
MNTIGKEIREFRKAYNLTRKELCKGICPVSHLSFIENNKVEAKPEVKQLLLERIEEFKSDPEIKNDTVLNENIGKFFFNERLKHGIKQETLCYGICTVSYLSKIENNKLVPSWNIKKLLYKRLEEIKNNTLTVDLEIL